MTLLLEIGPNLRTALMYTAVIWALTYLLVRWWEVATVRHEHRINRGAIR